MSELPEGTVTVLFTDVVGSTELTTRLGDDAAREMMGACDELAREQAERHRGLEVKGTGDGLMIAFQSARRAIACAADIQRAIASRNRREPHREVAVRIGLNTGEVIREEDDLFGATVHAAERIAGRAEAGEILVSEGVKYLLGPASNVELEDRGETELKGFSDPWRLFAVRWEEEPARSRTVERVPFVGRETEREELRRFLGRAQEGQGALVMIGGEPGVGKTRISEELIAEAQGRNMTALIGHCYEMEGAPPYLPFVEMLEVASRSFAPEAFRAALGDSAGEVARLMPELRRMFEDIPPPLELPPEQERHYLFNSLREFVQRASAGAPLILVLDDLHWADDSTLLLLQHVAQHLQGMSVLIIGTYRDVELDVGRPLARTLEDLLRQRLAHRIALRRLPADGVAAMLRAASGQEPPQQLVEAVYGETEGNPFFVEEVFQHLTEEGKLFDADGRWRPDLVVSELDVPEGVRLVIGRRLQHVSEETRRVLTDAAVVGRVFSFDLLEKLGETGPDVLLDAIDEAEQSHLITAVSEDDREARYSFVHELIRQTLLSGLSLPRRQRLHLRIAEAMEQIYAHSLDERTADLAHHLYQAGAAADAEKTVQYLSKAGERALAAAAFEEALHHLDTARSVLTGPEGERAAHLLFLRGQAVRSLGRWDEALEDWESALSVCERQGAAKEIGRICEHMAQQFGWNARWDEASATAQRGLRYLSKEASPERALLLAHAGWTTVLGGDYATGSKMMQDALAMSEGFDDPRLRGTLLTFLEGSKLWYVQPEEAVPYAEEALECLRRGGNAWNQVDALWQLQYSLGTLGRYDEAQRRGDEGELLATSIGHQGALISINRGRAGFEFFRSGDLAAFADHWLRDVKKCEEVGMPWISNAYTGLSSVRFWQGRWDEALAYAEDAARLEPPGMLEGWDWSVLVAVKGYRGERDAVLEMVDARAADFPADGSPHSLGRWLMVINAIDGLSALGERTRIATLYPPIQEFIGERDLISWPFGPIRAFAGVAAGAAGEYDTAEGHFRAALRQADELPAVIAQPETRRRYAAMLIDRDGPGDRERARSLLAEAITKYHHIGMPKHVEMAEAMLSEL